MLAAERHEEMELVGEWVEFMGYSCAEKGNKESSIVGKLVVINFYHEQFVGLSVPMGYPLIRSVSQGIKRAHVETGSQQRVRRPLTRRMFRGMQGSIASWVDRERVLWIGLPLSCLCYDFQNCLPRGEECIVKYTRYCLRRGDEAFSEITINWQRVAF